MGFWKRIGDLVRRLYVGPPLIMISIAAASVGSYLVPLQYQSSAFLVLTTPTSGGVLQTDPRVPHGESNPLLLFNDGLRTTAAILIHSVNTPETMRGLGAAEDSPTTLVIDDGRSNPELLGSAGPFMYVEAEARTAQEAHTVVVNATERIRSELADRQVALGAPPSTFITVVEVVAPSIPEPVVAHKLEMAGVVLVATLLVGFGVAYLVDARLAVRRARRSAAAPPAVEDYDFESEVPQSHAEVVTAH